MDDSRSVHSSRALERRAALPSQTASDVNFACRCCGGTEFRVEERNGWECLNSSLRCYQHAGLGDAPGTHNVYTCIRCAASVQRAHDELRDVLIGKLLFAAKHLAERQFTRLRRYGHAELVCAECRTPQVADSYLRHKDHCHVGRVLALLEALMQVDDPLTLQAAVVDGSESGSGSRVFHSFPLAGAEQGGVQ